MVCEAVRCAGFIGGVPASASRDLAARDGLPGIRRGLVFQIRCIPPQFVDKCLAQAARLGESITAKIVTLPPQFRLIYSITRCGSDKSHMTISA